MGFLDQIINDYGAEEKVKVRDPGKVERLLKEMVAGGSKKLQVITDFDFTLTRFHKDGKRCTSSHGIVDFSPLMPDEYRTSAKLLLDTYYPIEIDHTMSIDEKIPHMIEWYRKSQGILKKHQMSKHKIQEMVKSCNALMRDAAQDVLSFLNEHNVPCLIFSAGLGDLLEEVLHAQSAYYPNVKVISNFMIFNEQGECVDFKEPLIHMFNKNESALDNPKYFEELSHRNNALVLGDSVGDCGMDKGLHDPGAILKIGFLNDKIPERLDSFLDNFDVVLLDDQSFNFVNVILKRILTPQ